ncbi:MAG: HD domain-containing protein [Candidatus Magasanikbacteria bacterium]|jgi:putative hydrolases of HD superfamily|nr:HD domain-containing protein [Candidatus Magasanikbacteria bacterium]MBT4071127.1 HD domain-containing protein [Candidatus Magasanikbacteria bacterium]
MTENNSKNLEKIFNFLQKIENLKSTYRYSDTCAGGKESSADHSWRLALMAFIVADELKLDIDIHRAIKVALVHDLAEALTGDIDALLIAEGKVSAEDKNRQEVEAMKELKDTLPESIGNEISDLWYEYEDGVTEEAKFIKALDKIESLTQLVEVGYKMFDKPAFIANYPNKAVGQFPKLKGMLKILKGKLKLEFEKGNIEWKEEYNSLG